MSGHEPGYSFVAGVDLGLTRDCSAVVVLGVRNHDQSDAGSIRLAHTRLWKPVLGRKINLTDVEEEIRQLHKRYRLTAIAYDPWQAEHLSQRRRHQSLPMKEVPPTGSNLQSIAATTIESFTDRRLELFGCPNLKRDLLKLRVEERSYGYRLVSPRDETGHGDTASAFGLALLAANDQADKRPLVATAYSFGNGAWADNRLLTSRMMWSLGIHPDGHQLHTNRGN